MIVFVMPTIRKLAISRANEVAAFRAMNRHVPKLLQIDKVDFFTLQSMRTVIS